MTTGTSRIMAGLAKVAKVRDAIGIDVPVYTSIRTTERKPESMLDAIFGPPTETTITTYYVSMHNGQLAQHETTQTLQTL